MRLLSAKGMWARRRLVVLLPCFAALIVAGCATILWDPGILPGGKLLGEEENRIDASGYLIIPSTLGFTRGLPGGWELSWRLGFFGSFDTTHYIGGWDMPGFELLTGVSGGVSRTILDAEPFFVKASAELAGFTSSFGFEPGSMSAARGALGVTGGVYPWEGFGLYVPIALIGLTGAYANRQAAILFGAGVSAEPGHFVFRLSGQLPYRLLHQAIENKYELSPLPYLGLTMGYRW